MTTHSTLPGNEDRGVGDGGVEEVVEENEDFPILKILPSPRHGRGGTHIVEWEGDRPNSETAWNAALLGATVAAMRYHRANDRTLRPPVMERAAQTPLSGHQ